MSSEFSFSDATDKAEEQEDQQIGRVETTGYDVSDNIIVDLVDYTRSKTVENEEQFLLTTLCYFTGFMESPKHFASYVLIGTAGAGKSHIKNTIEDIIPEEYLYRATTGSEKSLIYDDTWEDAYFAALDELQKPSDEIIEILKSLHGGEDEEFRYKVTGGGEGADRDVDEIVRSAIPYGFLYAQYEPDFELWDRLIKIPVHESQEKNEGVARMQWDHSTISFGDTEVDYIYDFEDGEEAIREHVRNVPKDAWVKIPAGEDEFGWDAFEHVKHIFDINRSETNRVSSQVANLVRASALLNHHDRDQRRIKVGNEGTKDAFIVEPQDVANILCCRDVLLGTTHQLDRKRKAICVAIQQSGGTQQAASINKIQEYLKKTNASFVKRPQVEAMLKDLEDNYLVEKLEGEAEGGRNAYKFRGWQSLGKFEINDEFKRVFEDCVNPFNGEPFVETAKKINDNITPNASDFMSDGIDVSSDSEVEAQQTLAGAPSETIAVDLEPYEEAVYLALKDTLDGETINNLDEHDPTPLEMCGIVGIGEDDGEVETAGTVFDPSHEVWTYGPDEWVNSPTDAATEVSEAIRHLTTEGVLKTEVTERRGATPVTMDVAVRDIE